MLPEKFKIGAAIGILLLCSSSAFVTADDIWHQGPINCYTCDGVEECAQSRGVVRKCENNDDQTCVTVFNADGVVSRRGCSDDVHQMYNQYCTSNPDHCPACSSSGCNQATSLDQYVECLSCDSALDANCVRRPTEAMTTMCHGACMTALYPIRADDSSQTKSAIRYHLVRSCLNDRDLDEQALCLSGSDEHCIGCTGAKCNVQALPETQHSCYQCDGEDCEEPTPQECIVVSEEDQCYYLVNEAADIIRMGCRSDFDDDAIETLVRQRLLYLCNGRDCNDFDNLPMPSSCVQCETTEACATIPSSVTTTSNCYSIPYTHCYERVDADTGATHRGCLADLEEDEFMACLTGSGAPCRTCYGNECNNAIVPSDRTQCHRCDSNSDPTCAARPSALGVCPTYVADDACVTVLETDGTTRRGCRSDPDFDCDENSSNCQVCQGDGCNTQNLKKMADELYGIFQALPLNCNTCSGLEECASGVRNPRMCEGSPYQDCLTVFDAEGRVVRRGCEDSIESDLVAHCDQYPDLCFNCKSNGCNTVADANVPQQQCLYCDSATNADCLYQPEAVTQRRRCVEGCVAALYGRKSNPLVQDVVRTCVEDIELDDREHCTADANCVQCSEDECNTEALPSNGKERLSCYHCDGDDCDEPVARPCLGYAADDQCYIRFENVTYSAIAMGCRSEFTEAQVEQDMKRLFLCDGDNCNTHESLPLARYCYVCDSANDVDCAVEPASLSNRSRCQIHPYTDCYMRIRSDGHTERGCLSSLADDAFRACLTADDPYCRICSETDCNQAVFPSSRQRCHRCNSKDDAACESAPSSSQICPLYAANMQCVSALTVDGTTVRGCSSDVSCAASDTISCVACDTNDCNTANLNRKLDGRPGMWQELPLSCHTCDGAGDCATNTRLETCANHEYCMTVFGDDGAVTARGCSDAVEAAHGDYCNSNAANCHNCNSNECNAAISQDDYVECIYCDATTNANCTLAPSAVATRRMCHKACMTALHPRNATSVYDVVRSCLDDKDALDQNECSVGADAHCAACTSAACNTQLLPEQRLSCWSCEGDGCEMPEPGVCQSYREDEACFMEFDSTGDIFRMGCVSDLADAYFTANQHMMVLCNETDNCNSFDKVPSTYLCATCSSTDDPTCASDPANIATVEHCSTLPNTQCYTRVNSDGSTQRGCVGHLSTTQMQTCLSGDGSSCTTCVGDRCNVDVFPADRRRCHRCNSKDDPSCLRTPDAASACPVYSPSDFCTAKLVNGYVYRGCGSEFQCDDTDKYYCRQCNGTDNCNVVDFLATNIGYPGDWQGVPLNCRVCEGADDCAQGAAIRKCEGYELQTCGVVFDTDGSVVQRGCSDQIYGGPNAQHCDDDPASCKFCKSNGCNSATSRDDFVDCVYCDSREDERCITDVAAVEGRRSCHGQCMTALRPRSEAANTVYDLLRGCVDDKDMDEREACAAGEDAAHCRACSGAECNSDAFPETRLRCYQCAGGSTCDATAESKPCLGYREGDQCYMVFSWRGAVHHRGCVSDLSEEFIEMVKRRITYCDGDDCNSVDNPLPTPTACSICNSLTEPDCATNPAQVNLAAACDLLPYTSCYTHVDDAGVTHRGCLSDTDDDLFFKCLGGNSADCAICDTNNCNTEVFPAGRRSCSRCHSQSDADCATNPLEYAAVCPLYVADDTCMTAIDDHGFILRGCSSQFTCDTSARDVCRVCAGVDNCNTVDLLDGYVGEPGRWQGLPLNCYVCDGADACAAGATVHKCEGNNLQTCATVFGSAGEVVARGCSDSVLQQYADYCEANAGQCQRCKSNGCNTAANLDDYVNCYFCDSATSGAACSVELAGALATTGTRRCHGGCMVALYPRSSANDTAYETSRSCLDDMDMDEREACAAGEMAGFCQACQDALCNVMDLPTERHECYHCADADCEDAVTRQCSAYHPEDQCFILFDAESNIVDMGCRSAFESDVVAELVKQKRMIVCDGPNCNGLETVPTPTTCSVCDSVSDPRCATNPNLVANFERCSSLPYTECYTRVTPDRRTTRGCLADLPTDEFHACLTGDDELCEVCTGDKCNEINVFPADRLRCHQCSSSDDAACATDPSANYACPVYEANDVCVTSWRDGVTVRGCASSTTCHDPTDRRNCRTCTTSGCNTVNLELVPDEGEPGRWQDVPLSCYTCAGLEDCADRLGVFRVCEDNLYQGCMTVFDEEGRVVQRGCSDAVEAANAATCDAASERCPRCNSNGCNTATSLDDYVECLFCDSDANGDCVRQPEATAISTRRCHKQCMTALFERAAEENPAYGLARSCLDDMDLDDRVACAAGTNDHCVACSGASCNSVALPAQRLSCNTCADADDCQHPAPMTCSTYRPDDQCYVRYDEQRRVVAMGCRSEFTNADADYMVVQKRLRLCADGDNCNTLESMPATQSCVLCNSRTDPACATDPAGVASTTSCDQAPYTECYTRVVPANGATERGCLSSLYDDEFLGCLNGTDPSCVACSGDSCNRELFPSDRLSCHICDSDTDPACESSPDSLTLCPLYVAGDTCITTYTDGRTVRGCGSSVSCLSSNPRACRTCVGDGCNTVNLAAKQDNNFGKWQDLPLRCWTCSGDACSDGNDMEALTCENNNEQDCMTVFDEAERVVRRGCSDAVEAEYEQHCEQHPEHCFACKSNECNAAVSRDEYVECVYCDSFDDLECLWNPQNASLSTRMCRGRCMTALYESDGASAPGYDLIRTCLDDKESTAQLTCRNGLTKLCHACSESHCNVDDLPADRRQCHLCDGADCEQPTATPCPVYRENDMCYVWFDETNSVSQMGCLSSFRNQELEDLLRTKRVYVCADEDNCNAMDRLPVAQRCAVCNSAEDPLCATNAFEIGTIDECNLLPHTSCYSRVHSDGSTSRGCLSDLPADDFLGCLLEQDEMCALCSGDGCNRDVYPADRLQCYACSSEDDPACDSFPTTLTPCAVFSATESCKSALSGNVTVRGCSSDVFCDNTDKTTCRSCQATGCNAISLIDRVDDGYHGAWQDLPLRCHHCSGDHCLASLGPAYTCAVDGEEPQDCMTVFGETGEVRRRGCSHDVEDYEDLFCRQHPGHCHVCKSNECNSAWSLDDYVDCVFCNSTLDADCALNPAQSGRLGTRRCHKECMVATGHSAGEIVRSCLDDKELQVQHVCRTNESGQECASCDSSGCNDFAFPADRLSCHVCADAGCSSSEPQYCSAYVDGDFCFAKYNDVGVVELLGCASSQNASDLEAWTAAKKLVRCEGSDCNELSTLPTSGLCVGCDSRVNPACAQDPASVAVTDTCYAPHSQCLTRITNDGDTVRGCANVLADDEAAACNSNGTCALCDGPSCNKEVFPADRRKCYICNSVADAECEALPQTSLICPTYAADERCVAKRVDGVIERGCASDMTCDESDSDNCKICGSDNCNSQDMSGGAASRHLSLGLLVLLALVAVVGFRQ